MTNTQSKEIEKVKEAAGYYIDGSSNRDFELLCKGWHPECRMFGISSEKELTIYQRSIWKEWFDKPIDDPNYKRSGEILNVDVVGNAASVKVKIIVESSKGTTIFTDFLNLLKIKDKWQLVNKIFNTDFKPKE